jgi:hypothetical protein
MGFGLNRFQAVVEIVTLIGGETTLHRDDTMGILVLLLSMTFDLQGPNVQA